MLRTAQIKQTTIGLTLLAALLCININTFAQADYYNANYLRYEDYIYKVGIRTVMAYSESSKLSYPLIQLYGAEKIVIEFDEMTELAQTYSYTVMHCDANWKPSDLDKTEYIDGFFEDEVRNYDESFNTQLSYVNYRISLPNDEMSLMLSGNYVLFVYQDFDKNKPVLTKRFCIVEPRVDIEGEAHRATLNQYREDSQEVDFSIDISNYPVDDPSADLIPVVLQNNRWDNALRGLKPQFIEGDRLIYDYSEENVFPGGEEFLYFDIKSMKFNSERLARIVYNAPDYHAFLMPDKQTRFDAYHYHEDLNGRMFIENNEANNDHIEAEYVKVHFTLPYEYPVVEGNLYIIGALTNWSIHPANRLSYNYDQKAYDLTLLLKQGYYNYQYVFLPDGEIKGDHTYVNGSYYQTENDYLIYVYHRDVRLRYDKLIGVKVVNSLKRQ